MSNAVFSQQVSLQVLNTLGLPAIADYFIRLNDLSVLPSLVNHPIYQQGPVLWLGGGSNLVLQNQVPGLVIQVATQGITVVQENDEYVWVDVAAGENWHQWVQTAIGRGWFGLENLSLIPGTVGAAPVQNIGAYGVEVKDVIDSVYCVDTRTAQTRIFTQAECDFSYRQSIFKGQEKGHYLIATVRFKLSKVFRPHLGYGDLQHVAQQMAGDAELCAQTVSNAVIQVRQSKLPDPKVLGNVGSFFHNPIVDEVVGQELLKKYARLPLYPYHDKKVKLAAGWLIDQAGLKGHQIGGAAVHTLQALVLVNKGGATFADVLALCQYVQEVVYQKFGIHLIPEPNFIPA